MARRIQFKVTGDDKLRIKFKDLEGLDMSKPLAESCNLVRRSAVLYCPSGTGRLRRSITVLEHYPNESAGTVVADTHYAPYVEFGTGLFAAAGNGRKDVPWRYQDEKGEWHTTIGQHPQPFMHPALEHNKENIKRIFQQYFGEKLAK